MCKVPVPFALFHQWGALQGVLKSKQWICELVYFQTYITYKVILMCTVLFHILIDFLCTKGKVLIRESWQFCKNCGLFLNEPWDSYTMWIPLHRIAGGRKWYVLYWTVHMKNRKKKFIIVIWILCHPLFPINIHLSSNAVTD